MAPYSACPACAAGKGRNGRFQCVDCLNTSWRRAVQQTPAPGALFPDILSQSQSQVQGQQGNKQTDSFVSESRLQQRRVPGMPKAVQRVVVSEKVGMAGHFSFGAISSLPKLNLAPIRTAVRDKADDASLSSEDLQQFDHVGFVHPDKKRHVAAVSQRDGFLEAKRAFGKDVHGQVGSHLAPRIPGKITVVRSLPLSLPEVVAHVDNSCKPVRDRGRSHAPSEAKADASWQRKDVDVASGNDSCANSAIVGRPLRERTASGQDGDDEGTHQRVDTSGSSERSSGRSREILSLPAVHGSSDTESTRGCSDASVYDNLTSGSEVELTPASCSSATWHAAGIPQRQQAKGLDGPKEVSQLLQFLLGGGGLDAPPSKSRKDGKGDGGKAAHNEYDGSVMSPSISSSDNSSPASSSLASPSTSPLWVRRKGTVVKPLRLPTSLVPYGR